MKQELKRIEAALKKASYELSLRRDLHGAFSASALKKQENVKLLKQLRWNAKCVIAGVAA